MPDLLFLIPDPALRAALQEQCRALSCATAATWAEARTVDDVKILVADLDTAPRAQPEPQTNAPCLFTLGGATATDRGTEHFIKPFRLGDFLARVRYRLDIAPRLKGARFTLGPWLFDATLRQIESDDGTVVRLTEKETALLAFLGQSATAQSREDVLATVWGYDARIDTHTLETHIYQLRRKLAQADGEMDLLITEQGRFRLAEIKPAPTV